MIRSKIRFRACLKQGKLPDCSQTADECKAENTETLSDSGAF